MNMDKSLKKQLEEEFNYCYDLIRKNYSINFEKPLLCGENKITLKLQKRLDTEKTLFSKDIEMFFKRDTNEIYALEKSTREESRIRCYTFLHEFGHALTFRINPTISEYGESVKNQSELERRREVAIFHSFEEGIADYIAINSCAASDNDSLKATGKEIEILFNVALDELINSFEEEENGTWKEVIRYLFSNAPEGLLTGALPNIIGHHFVSNIKDFNLEKIIKSPPTTIEQLLYPKSYRF